MCMCVIGKMQWTYLHDCTAQETLAVKINLVMYIWVVGVLSEHVYYIQAGWVDLRVVGCVIDP